MYTDQLRLFTKLKNNKQIGKEQQAQKNKIPMNYIHISNIKQVSSQTAESQIRSYPYQLSCRSSVSISENQSANNQYLMDIKLSNQQIKEIEKLKYDKICYVVDKCLSTGHNVRQVLQSDVLNNLQMQIWEIYVTGTTKYNYMHQHNQKLGKQENNQFFYSQINHILNKYKRGMKKYKIDKQHIYCEEQISNSGHEGIQLQEQSKIGKHLQSTAEYYERTPNYRQNVKIGNADIIESVCPNSFNFNSNNTNSKKSVSNQKLFFNRSKCKKISSQSTIKNLQSPQCGPRVAGKISSNSSFNQSKVHSNLYIKDYSQQQCKKQNGQQLNIDEFTLGQLGNIKENQCSIEKNNHDQQNFTQRQAQDLYYKNQQNKCITDFSQYQSKQISSYSPMTLQDKNSNGLTFNKRRKLPKGKVIKYKVMGNINQCNEYYNSYFKEN